MYCPNCGAYNDNSYNNCISCGKYIADINKSIRQAAEEKIVQHSVEPVSEERPVFEASVSSEHTEEVITDTSSASFNDKKDEIKNSVQNNNRYESVYREYVKKPKEYFILSILCTIFGSLGFGIAAIVFSVMTKAEISSGNIKKASIYSQNTKIFCIFSIVIGIIKYVFMFIVISACLTPSVNYYTSPFFW